MLGEGQGKDVLMTEVSQETPDYEYRDTNRLNTGPPSDTKVVRKRVASKGAWMKEERDKRPSESNILQQKLPSWQPIIIPRLIQPLYWVFGISFVILGVCILLSLSGHYEFIADYTNCDLEATENFTRAEFSPFEWKFNETSQVCTIRFDIAMDVHGPILLEYKLTHFFQNYRRYLRSKATEQLRGAPLAISQLSGCFPLIEKNGIAYYPCGLVANSYFNDTFSSLYQFDGEKYDFSETGLVWSFEREKFKRTRYLPSPNGTFLNILPPPEWTKYGGQYTNETIPDLGADEHFMIWMRVSQSSSFRKPYGQSFDSLKAGTWMIDIQTQYQVRQFQGTKSIVITTMNWLNGSGPFIGYAFIAGGIYLLFLATLFMSLAIAYPRKLGDENLLSWVKEEQDESKRKARLKRNQVTSSRFNSTSPPTAPSGSRVSLQNDVVIIV